jgi:hypothetical protein
LQKKRKKKKRREGREERGEGRGNIYLSLVQNTSIQWP